MGHCYWNAVVKMHQILVLTRQYVKKYDEKIKPLIQYSFTQYNINFTQQSWINQAERCLQKGLLSVIEEVTDNVTLSVDLQIRRLTNTI